MKRTLKLSLIMVAVLAVVVPCAWGYGSVSRVNKTIRMPRNTITRLHFSAGPIVFEELIIRNRPDANDIRKAKSDPNDKSHPKLQLGMSNRGDEKMKIEAAISFEDSKGNVYMECERSDTLEAGAVNEHTNFCWLDSIKTIDWPNVTVVRINASISPDR